MSDNFEFSANSFQATLHSNASLLANNVRLRELENRMVEQARRSSLERADMENRHHQEVQLMGAQFARERDDLKKKRD